MRVRLKELNSTRKRIADGTETRYWYAWKGGPRLNGQLGTPEFMASYQAAVMARTKPAEDTLLSVMPAYQASNAYTSRGDSSRRDYLRYIKIIEAEFADFPLEGFTGRRARGELLAWRDRLAIRSHQQAHYA